MPKKKYKITKDALISVNEPVEAYVRDAGRRVTTSEKWSPNAPFYCTQEEFLEHIHQIEQSEFTSLEEANKEFEAWKKEYLANRLK